MHKPIIVIIPGAPVSEATVTYPGYDSQSIAYLSERLQVWTYAATGEMQPADVARAWTIAARGAEKLALKGDRRPWVTRALDAASDALVP
jgi:hypothetical protein